MFRNFSKRLADVINRMGSISFGTVDQKLAKALLAFGSNTIPKTHNELALELGSAREVVSRHLKRFESLGWVSLNRGSIEIINFDALKKTVNSNEER